MYLEHFGLNEPPFRITPHTDFFFDGANRGATLDALIYAITHDEGIVKVSGEVGSGKTMLCRVLMERLPDTVTIVYLANPSLSRDDILYAIADELRLDIPDNSRTSMVMRALQDRLIQSYGEGRQVVVLIDEAHAMPADTLEEIRLLSNLESNHSKLLQLVLFGQPELNDILARPDMRQLKERITHNFGLEPLVRDDIANYLDFRMRAAGYRGPSVFSLPALKLIAQSSLGLTRRINIIADKSLLAAFSAGSHQIGAKETQAAIKDCEFSEATYRGKGGGKKRLLWLAAAILVAALLAIFVTGLARQENSSAAPPPSPSAGSGEKAAAPSPSSAPTPILPQSVADPVVIVSAPATPAGSLSVPAAPAPAPTPTAPVAVSPAPTPGTSTAAGPVETRAALPASVETNKPDSSSFPRKVGRMTRERLESSRPWLEQLPSDRWFIQIFAADAERHGEVESLLRRLAATGEDSDQLRVYFSELSGRPRYGVIYGEYPSREKATAAMRGLSKQLRANKPYPRPATRLR